MNTIKSSFIALACCTALACAPAAHAQSTLDGHTLTLQYGLDLGTGWQSIKTVDFTVGSGVEVPSFVLASNAGGTTAWSLDAGGNSIKLSYIGTADFMNYGSPQMLGFRLIDRNGTLGSINGVTVTNTVYVPQAAGNLIEGFDPGSALSFDADNIYVNLNAAMYHHHAMPGMGDPLRDSIVLSVNAAAVPEPQTWALMLGGLALAALRRRAAAAV